MSKDTKLLLLPVFIVLAITLGMFVGGALWTIFVSVEAGITPCLIGLVCSPILGAFIMAIREFEKGV